MRVARSARAVLNIAHAGQGKTLAMIGSVEQFRDAHGVRGVIVITKKAILGYTSDDILTFVRRTTSLDMASHILPFYRFYTYQTFNDGYGNLSPEELRAAMKGYILVLDECHTVMSYLTRPRDGFRSPYETLVLVRNLLPDTLIIAMSATPMLNSPFEIRFVAHILVTQEQLNRDFPGCEDHCAVALGEEPQSWLAPADSTHPRAMPVAPGSRTAVIGSAEDEMPPELYDSELGEDQRYAAAIIKNVAIMYTEPPQAARQRRFGTPFRLGDELAALVTASTPPPYGGHLDMDKDVYVRAILPMGSAQRKAYLENFTKEQFYRTAREITVCDAEGLETADPQTLADVGRYSALFYYWLRIETRAHQEGHWGASAWYMDDIVTKGALTLNSLFLKFGWRPWSPVPVPTDPRPTVLLLTGKDTLTAAMRAQLFSPENVRGQLIRTIIYTSAARDGVSFPGALRGGSVLGWSEAGQLQADARRLRVNSFDHFQVYMRDPIFLQQNHMYIGGTEENPEINPHTYDVLSVPGGQFPHEGLPISDFRPHYSVDAHMLKIRARKGRDIQQVFETLVAGSIDVLANSPGPSVPGNYLTHHLCADIRRSLISLDTQSGPRAITSIAAPGVPIEILGYYTERAFFDAPAGEAEGPIGGTREYLWGLGSMGLGPAPADLARAAASDFGDPENMNVLQMIRPSDDEMCTMLRMKLRQTLGALSDAMLRTDVEKVDKYGRSIDLVTFIRKVALAFDFGAFVREVGSASVVLLAMYSRLWCVGVYDEQLAFGEKFPTRRCDAPQTENTRASNWSKAVTTLYGTVPGAEPRVVQADWYPPCDEHKKWLDPNSIQACVQRWSHGCTQDINYIVITHQLNIKTIPFFAARQPVYMLAPWEPIPTERGGVKQSTGVSIASSQGPALIAALNYDERRIEWSRGQFSSVKELSHQAFGTGAVYRYVLIPENNTGARPRIDLTDIQGTATLQVVREGSSGHARQYLAWAETVIRNRLFTYWTAKSSK
jgi:hypothetical protein